MIRKVVESKTLDDIPDDMLKDIKIMSVPPGEATPFGSFITRSNINYGDLDLIQEVKGCCSADEVASEVAASLQQMVMNIVNNKEMFLSEVKCGLDSRFDFSVGVLENGVFTPAPELALHAIVLHTAKIITDDDLKVVSLVLDKPQRNGDDYDALFNMFRDYRILRWNEDEILRGTKTHKRKEFKLADCMKDDTPLKIDVQTIDGNNKFIEVTNYIAIGYESHGEFVPLNINLRDDSPLKLVDVIEELYFSDYHYNPFKMVKRMFSLLKYLWNNDESFKLGLSREHVEDLILKVRGILKKTINILYTVRSELDAMKLILKKSSSVSKQMKKRLDMLKINVSNVLELSQDDVTTINNMLDAIKKNLSIRLLDDLMTLMKKHIDYHTIVYLEQYGLNPPPEALCNNRYERKMRNPMDDPVNPLGHLLDTPRGGFLKSLAKKAFRKVANAYRSKFCRNSRPLKEGEIHYGCHNFTGPGTRIDLKSVQNTEPYNSIDACSKQHDLDYKDALEADVTENERKEMIRDADHRVVACYDRHPRDNGYRIAKLGINSKMRIEDAIPFVARSMFGNISAAGKDYIEWEEVAKY